MKQAGVELLLAASHEWDDGKVTMKSVADLLSREATKRMKGVQRMAAEARERGRNAQFQGSQSESQICYMYQWRGENRGGG